MKHPWTPLISTGQHISPMITGFQHTLPASCLGQLLCMLFFIIDMNGTNYISDDIKPYFLSTPLFQTAFPPHDMLQIVLMSMILQSVIFGYFGID